MGSNIASGWTDERVEHLKTRWHDGASAGVIAKELGGVTRNAVIGKVCRLGLTKRTAASKPQHLPRPQRIIPARTAEQKVQSANHPWKAGLAPKLHPAGNRVYVVSPDAPLPPPLPVGLAENPKPWEQRAFGECAYIVSGTGEDAIACCNPGPESASWCYCATHKALMTAKPSTAHWTPEQRAAAKARLLRRVAAQRAAA